jgi:hypothetical protein
MRSSLLLLSTLFLASGCVVGDFVGQGEGDDGGFAQNDDRPTGEEIDEGDDDDDLQEDVDEPDEPDEPADDDDDDDDEPLWDWTPPAAVGVRIEGVVQCGWLAGPSNAGFEFDGQAWQQYQTEGSAEVRPELLPCTGAEMDPDFNKRLHWDADGSIYFEAAGLGHDLWPSTIELMWLGDVFPLGEPSDACLHALEEAGVVSPMMMSFTVESIVYPD